MLIKFSTWDEVLAAAKAGRWLWYHAPLDLRACSVTVVKVYKNGKIRIRGGDCSFVADAGHLDRFRVQQKETSGV